MLSVLAVVALGVPGTGRSEPPDADSEQAATEHYERGMKAFEAGDYEKAVSELRTVYDLRPDPIVLYNIALAEWRTGDIEAATIAAERAKREGLPDRAFPKTDGRIAGFRVISQSKGRASEISEATTADGVAPTRPEPGRSGARRGLTGRGWTGIATAATGLGLLGGAFAIERSLATQLKPYRRAAEEGDTEEYREFQETRLGDLRRLQTFGRILFGVGVAATATGSTLLVWDVSSTPASTDRTARLRIIPRMNGAGLSLEF